MNLAGIRRHVRFLLDGGLRTGNGILLACGAAGGFRTMSLDERIQVAAAVIEEAGGRIPFVVGAQDCPAPGRRVHPGFAAFLLPGNRRRLLRVRGRSRADAADIGIIVYNTYTSSSAVERRLVERLVDIPNLIGLKWATPASDFMASVA